MCVAFFIIFAVDQKSTTEESVMCIFSSPPAPPPPDPDVEIERENQEQEEEQRREEAKQDRLEDTVQRAGGGSGGTTVPSLLTSTRGGIGYYDETL